MEKLSDLISKQVISIEDGLCIGYILDACIDYESFSINGFLIVDDESEKVSFLQLKNIFAINHFVMIKNCDMLSFGENVESFNPIGKIVVTEKGENIGKINDVFFDNKKIVKLTTDKAEILPKNISNFYDKILLFKLKNNKKKTKSEFPKIGDMPVVDVKIEAETKEKFYNRNTTKGHYQIPFKTKISIDGLLGKFALSDVFGKNNEIIVRKNEIITQKIITNAKKHGVENYLIFNCR